MFYSHIRTNDDAFTSKAVKVCRITKIADCFGDSVSNTINNSITLNLCNIYKRGFDVSIMSSKLLLHAMIYYNWTASSEFGTYRPPMRAAKVQASLRIRAVSPEPPLLAHTRRESRITFRQKARSLAPLNGWACAVKICHDGMLEDTNSLGGAHIIVFCSLVSAA